MGDYDIGKQSGMQVRRADATADQGVGIPGKSTLVEQSGYAGWSGQGISLGAADRAQLALFLVGRMTTAEGRANTAIAEIKTKLALEGKEESELSVWANIVVGAVFSNIALAIKIGARFIAMRGQAKHLLEEAGVTASVSETPELGEWGDGEIEAIVGSSVDAAKDVAKPVIARVAAPDADSHDKADAFLDMTSDQIGERFQNLLEWATVHAPAAQLVKLCEAFDARYNTVGGFVEKIETQMRRYMGSHAAHIGREGPMGTVENKVAWLKHDDGSKQLIYVCKTFDLEDGMRLSDRSAYNGEHALSLSDATEPTDEIERKYRPGASAASDANVGFVGFVEPDLVQTALAAHEARWLAEPKTYDWTVVMGGQQ